MNHHPDRSVRILLLGARRRIFFVERLRAAARALGKEVFVVYADTDDLDPAAHVCDAFVRIPSSSASDYVEAVAATIREWRIALTVPWNDKDIDVINRHRSTAFSGFDFFLPPEEATRVFLDKLEFARWCQSSAVPHPRMLARDNSSPALPCVVKPRFGQGSVGVTICHDEVDYRYGLRHADEPVVQEFVDGEEITVDVYCWPVSLVFACVPRLRLKTRGGEVLIAKTVSDRFARPLAETIARALRIDGPFNFQYIVSNGRPHVIEANPRMGGGTDLSVAAGADLPRYLLERVLTGRLSSAPPAIREGLVMSRYHDAVFFAHPPEAAATAPRMSLEAERAGQIAI